MAFGHLRPAQRPAALRRYQGKLREKLYRSAEMQLGGSTFTVIAQQIGVTKKSADDLTREAFARIIGLQRTEKTAQQT